MINACNDYINYDISDWNKLYHKIIMSVDIPKQYLPSRSDANEVLTKCVE